MIPARLTLLSPLALALVACAPSDEGEDERAPKSPFGYELAMAKARDEAPVANPDAAPNEPPTASAMIDLTPEQVRERLAAGEIRLIDVRTDEEVAQGMIPGAEHIALDKFDPALLDTSDGRQIVLYCRSGRRSSVAGEALAGFTGEPSQHLAGGILAWEDAGEPIEIP